MDRGEVPGHRRTPVVAGDVHARPAEGLDDPGDILHQLVHAIVLDTARGIAQSVAAHVGRHRQRSCLGECVDLPGPRLGAFGEPVEEDDHLTARGPVDHRPEAKAVGLHHVLAGGHLMFLLKKSVATSSAWSRTASSPCPWPLNISSRAFGMSLIFSCKSSMRAKGSRSPL